MTVSTFMTADELIELRDDGCKYELVNGELRKMSPSGSIHMRISAEIIASLIAFVKPRRLGTVGASEGGFRLSRDPDTVLAPDAVFVRAARWVERPQFFEGPPDIAFEVVSPNDRYSEIEEKIKTYLRYGTPVVVIVDPQTSTVRVHRRSGVTTIAEVLEIDDVLPGWKLPLSEVFR